MEDRKYIAKARQIANIFDDDLDTSNETAACVDDREFYDGDSRIDRGSETAALRIQTRQSPYIDTFYAHHPIRITVDSGATGNMIRHSGMPCYSQLTICSSSGRLLPFKGYWRNTPVILPWQPRTLV